MTLASALLIAGLYQAWRRSARSDISVVRVAVLPEVSLLRSLAQQKIGAFGSANPEFQDAVLYHHSVTYRGIVHPRAGQFVYCGRISQGNFPGFHYHYRSFVASAWISYDGAPLPDPAHEKSFALLDDPGDPAAHASFVQTVAALCRNEVLPDSAPPRKQPPESISKP